MKHRIVLSMLKYTAAFAAGLFVSAWLFDRPVESVEKNGASAAKRQSAVFRELQKSSAELDVREKTASAKESLLAGGVSSLQKKLRKVEKERETLEARLLLAESGEGKDVSR